MGFFRRGGRYAVAVLTAVGAGLTGNTRGQVTIPTAPSQSEAIVPGALRASQPLEAGGNRIEQPASADIAATTIRVGRRPSGVAISGRFAYVTVEGEDKIAVIDLASPSLTGAIPLAYLPHDIGVSSDGNLIFVASDATPLGFPYPSDDCSSITKAPSPGKITAIETRTNRIAFEIPVTSGIPKLLRVNGRGDRAFVVTIGGTLETLDLVNRTTLAVDSLSFSPQWDAVLHPDDRRLFAVSSGNGPDLAVLDSASGQLRPYRFASDGYQSFFGGRPAVDPSERYLFFNGAALGSSLLARFTLVFDTVSERLHGSIPGGFGGIVFSPDGNRAYLFSPESLPTPGGVIVTIPDLTVVGTLPVGGYPAALSRDGRKVFLSRTGSSAFYTLTIFGDLFRFRYDLTIVDLASNTAATQDLSPDLVRCTPDRAMALSQDGATLILTNPALDTVTVFSMLESRLQPTKPQKHGGPRVIRPR